MYSKVIFLTTTQIYYKVNTVSPMRSACSVNGFIFYLLILILLHKYYTLRSYSLKPILDTLSPNITLHKIQLRYVLISSTWAADKGTSLITDLDK